MISPEPYSELGAWYDDAFDEHGLAPEGVGWVDQRSADVFYKVSLDVINPEHQRPSLLDFGCGTAGLVEYIERTSGYSAVEEVIDYYGIDISEKLVAAAKARYPMLADHITCEDILQPGTEDRSFDYAIANGTFTLREGVSHDDMWDFMRAAVTQLLDWTTYGISYHVLSIHRPYETFTGFHVPYDDMAAFLQGFRRYHYTFRTDYDEAAYTVYVWHDMHL